MEDLNRDRMFHTSKWIAASNKITVFQYRSSTQYRVPIVTGPGIVQADRYVYIFRARKHSAKENGWAGFCANICKRESRTFIAACSRITENAMSGLHR